MSEGTRTPIDPGIVAKVAGMATGAVSGAVGGLIKGVSEAWFGPLQPIQPMAPPEVKGRAFDYPFGMNLSFVPRGEAGQGGVTFQTLRDLSDPTRGGFDLLRLVIETRKDQMSAQPWKIQPRKDKESNATLKRAAELTDRWGDSPDGEHDWLAWQRLLVEDLLVIDAPTVYLAPFKNGEKRPEVVDGATIKRLVREDGRTPVAPDPAYQQRLKGMAAVDYSTDELIYFPRNPRPDRIYGMSPVEQVLMTIDIALRRQLSQREYYSAGSIPDLLLGVPEGWTLDQIKQYQQYFDALLSGNTEERRRARFVPGGLKPFSPKENNLKDEYDEWLSRIICFSFSISPTALIKQVNRASGETMEQTAQEQGLEPLKLYWRSLMNRVMRGCFSDGGLFEFAFEDEEIVDPEVKATVYSTALGKKAWMTLDEVRERHGLQPATDEQKEELTPAPAPSPFGAPPTQLALPGTDDGTEADEVMQARVRRAKRTGRVLRRARSQQAGSQCVCRVHPRRYP